MAKNQLEIALDICLNLHGLQHIKVGCLNHHLAMALSSLGNAREAKEFYLRALSIFEQHFGHNHVQLADTINNLGNAASDLGDANSFASRASPRSEAAFPRLLRVLASCTWLCPNSIFEQHFGHNHVQLANTINNLGNAAIRLGDAHEAKEFYLRALSIFEQHFGHNHVQLASTLNNLGNAASDLGDAREAKEFYLRALSSRNSTLDTTMCNLPTPSTTLEMLPFDSAMLMKQKNSIYEPLHF